MTIQTAKQTFRETLAALGYKVSIKRTGIGFDIQPLKGGRKMTMNWSTARSVLYLEEGNHIYNEALSASLTYVESVARLENIPLLRISSHFELDAIMMHRDTQFISTGNHPQYNQLTELMSFPDKESYLFEVEEGYIQKLYDFHTRLHGLFQHLQREHPTTVFKPNLGYINDWKISFYHHGIVGKIEAVYQAEIKRFHVTIFDKDRKVIWAQWSKEDPSSFDEPFLAFFTDLYKKNRLQNVYTPPTFHLSQFFKSLRIGQKLQKQIQPVLLDHFQGDVDALETALATRKEKFLALESVERGTTDYKMVHVSGKLLLIDLANLRFSHFSIHEADEAFNMLDAYVMNDLFSAYYSDFYYFEEAFDELKTYYHQALSGEFGNPVSLDDVKTYIRKYQVDMRIVFDKIIVHSQTTKMVKTFSFEEKSQAKQSFLLACLNRYKQRHEEKIQTFQSQLLLPQ